MQILIGLDEDQPAVIPGIAVLREQVDHIDHKENDEDAGVDHQMLVAALQDGFVGHIIAQIEETQGASQEEYGQSEDEYPWVEQGVKAVGGVGPTTDDWRQGIDVDEVVLLDDEVATLEEGGYGSAQEQWAHNAVEHQEALERGGTEEIAEFVLELIADGLQHKRKEDEHPQPVGAAKRRRIEQRIGGKERSAEGDQRGECELPLATCAVDEQTSLLSCLAQ